MSGRALTVEQVLTLLAETPSRIAALTTGLAAGKLSAAPSPDAWSANDVLAHLRACADIGGDCIRAILAEDRPTLTAVNPRTWVAQAGYPALDFHASLGAFATQRAALLAILEPLPREAWARAARVRGAGRARERTVLEYGQWLAPHERRHVEEIARMARVLQRAGRPRPAARRSPARRDEPAV